METSEIPSRSSAKKTPARKGRKSKGKAPKKSNQKVKPTESNELNVSDENLNETVESSSVDMVDSKAEIVTKEKTLTETIEIGQKSKGEAVTNSKQKANIEDSKKDENIDKSVEMNIENIGHSKEEILTKMKATGSPETERKSRGKAAKRTKNQAKTKDSELNMTDVNLDKSVEMMTGTAENVDISKKDTVTKDVVKPVEKHVKKTENVESSENVTERMETLVSETTEIRLESDNAKSVMEEQTKTSNALSESDDKEKVDLEKSKEQKEKVNETECSEAGKLEDSDLLFNTKLSESKNQSDIEGKVEVKDLTGALKEKQCTVQNQKPELPSIVSESAMDTEESQIKAKESSSENEKTIETLADKVNKKNDKPLTDADGQKDPKLKESEQQKRNNTENTVVELNDRCADVGLVSVSDTHEGDSVEKVKSNSNKEVEAKTSKTDKSDIDDEKNNDSMDKGAIAAMEDSRDPDTVKMPKIGESQTEINTGACAVEDASKSLKQSSDDSLGKEAAMLKENVEEPASAKVSVKEKTDTEVKIETAVEKEAQMSTDSESTPKKYNDTMETEGKSVA